MKYSAVNVRPILVFWGGVENGFWGFAHKPVEYAKSVKVPALLFYGEKDERMNRQEIDDVYKNREVKINW